VILGVDPGYGRCGWGVVECRGNSLHSLGCGVIETPAGRPLPGRLLQLHDELEGVIRRFTPTEAAMEELFFSKNVKTGISVGQARGVLILACIRAGLDVAEYKPVEIKLAVTGYGAAAKGQVQKMVQTLLRTGVLAVLDDAIDALAVAICHAHSYRPWAIPGKGGR
jgi:crossover junction endodeoxyribonuclease RuvC